MLDFLTFGLQSKHMEPFKDNFSRQSDIYLKYRPLYPTALYSYLASLVSSHELVWDCGTGNGQAAIGLADFFNQVFATDPSEQQIANSIRHDRVHYKIEKAEQTGLTSNSVDLVTTANALHWFDLEGFFNEASRVLKPNGVIAVWAYGNPTVSPDIDAVVQHYHDVVLHNYWLPENRLVEKGYSTISFPYQLLETPEFQCDRNMNRADFIGLLNTWSATQRYININIDNPTDHVASELCKYWPDTNEEKEIVWKLVLKVGRVNIK